MSQPDPIELLSQLTERQRDVLKYFCDGLEYKDIADLLFIGLSTVKSHMGNIYVKLGLINLSPSVRRKLLYEDFCQKLRGDELLRITPESESEDPIPISRAIIQMVEDDERALLRMKPTSIESISPPAILMRGQTIPSRRRLQRWMINSFLLGALLVTLILLPFLLSGRRLDTRVESVPVTVLVEVQKEVTVVVSPTQEPDIPTSTVAGLKINDIQSPTPTFTPSPIPSATPVIGLISSFDGSSTDGWKVNPGRISNPGASGNA